MATETQDTTTATSADSSSGGSYVQSILGSAGGLGSDESSSDVQPSQQPEAQEPGTAPGQPDTSGAADKQAAFDELMEQYARETGKDSSDPNQRKDLKRLVDKELYIRELKASLDAAAQAKAAAQEAGPELQTAFEKELAAEATEAAKGPPEAAQEQPAQATGEKKPPEPLRYRDVGDEWKTPEDSLTALNDAWAENDLKQVHQIEMARLRRNFDSDIAPKLFPYIERMIEQRLNGFVERDLGDVVPEVRRSVQDRRISESREFAIDELRKAGAGDIEKLFEQEDGPPIEYDGQQFPNTPLNRILAKHPEIMRIVENHPDSSKAERRTFISRYKLAYQIFKNGAGGVSAQTAKKLVDAGRESKERETSDVARQTINAGSGASGRGEKPSNRSYIQELNNLPGEVPFASLL